MAAQRATSVQTTGGAFFPIGFFRQPCHFHSIHWLWALHVFFRLKSHQLDWRTQLTCRFQKSLTLLNSIELDGPAHRSIALWRFYEKSFESESIGLGCGAQIWKISNWPLGGTAWTRFNLSELANERLIRWPRNQKKSCRALNDLSTDARIIALWRTRRRIFGVEQQ